MSRGHRRPVRVGMPLAVAEGQVPVALCVLGVVAEEGPGDPQDPLVLAQAVRVGWWSMNIGMMTRRSLRCSGSFMSMR